MLSVPQSPLLFLLCCCSLLVSLVVSAQISAEIQHLFIVSQQLSFVVTLDLSCSLDGLLWARCRLFRGRSSYFGCLGKWKTCYSSSRLANKCSLLMSGEGSVKAKSCSLADSAAASTTVAVTPAQSESPNFHSFDPESRHDIQTSRGHAFKLWKTVFYTGLLYFQHLLSPGPSNVRHVWPSLPEPSIPYKWFPVTVNTGICSPSRQNLSSRLPPVDYILTFNTCAIVTYLFIAKCTLDSA